jgi:NAD dependent epimerase/dehydratase family enzyme
MTVSRIVERITNFCRLIISSSAVGIYDTVYSINLSQDVSCLRHFALSIVAAASLILLK